MAEDINRCKDDDPRRCQSVDARGQCDKISVPGYEFCKMHVGAKAILDKKAVSSYRLAMWEGRLSRLADENGVKSLRGEIGILKMTLEAVVARCHTTSDLIENTSKIGELTQKIEKVVLSCNRLEKTTGMMLDKTAALQIAANIVTIIGEHVKDEATVTAITDQIIAQVLNVETQVEDSDD